ncbi:MAG TPA: hypothetical protein VKG02_24910 [Blastocatellia bacterium]|nr:hypothetical protein [Blastocatellia bacterium]
MSQAVFEQVLIGIQSLPPESLAKLREILNAPSEREQRLEAARALAMAEDEDGDEERKFRRLADQWLHETEHASSVKQACMHPSYQRIIGMGPAVVPYVLRELERNPDHWFWALNAIAEEDPARAEDSLDGAKEIWLRWGREKGYL